VVQSQTYRSTIRGTVLDQQGAAYRGAEIRVTNRATQETRTVQTGDGGEYSISSLTPGSYAIESSAPNFAKGLRYIDLGVNQDIRVDITLEIGKIDAASEVVASALQQDSASLGTVIENKQVTGLPLDGRNFYELTLLVPGAVPAAPGSAGSVRGDFAFSVNGAREDANNFLLDGVYNVDPKLNTFGVRPSVDAIREFEMLTSTYDASFGRNP